MRVFQQAHAAPVSTSVEPGRLRWDSLRAMTDTVDSDFVTTLSELPGYRTVAAHGIVGDIGSAAGKTAKTKGMLSLIEALQGAREAAAKRGGNAIVGLQIATFGASTGGAFGDAVGTAIIGTAVTVEPIE